MRLFKISPYKALNYGFILLIISLFSFSLSAQQNAKPARILFLLDASSSMTNKWIEEENRFATAARIITSICDSIYQVNSDVTFGVRVFGNQFPAQDKNCFDSRLEVSFGYANSDQIKRRLRHINPIGYSPIAWALKEAAEKDFTESSKYAYSIILITDGGESCEGDICLTVETLLNSKISFKPYILSLVDYEPLGQEYECLGTYMKIVEENDIAPAIKTIIEDNQKILSVKSIGMQPIHHQENTTDIRSYRKPEIKISQKQNNDSVFTDSVQPSLSGKDKSEHMLRIRYLTQPKTLKILYTQKKASTYNVPALKILPSDIIPEKTASTLNEPRRNPEGIIEPIKTINRKDNNESFVPVKPIVSSAPTEVITKQTPSEETLLLVHFVAKGTNKPYFTEPKLVFLNSATKSEVKSIYRNVTGREPDPIKMDPGIYDITIPGSASKALNVQIHPNMVNHVTIAVGKASLAFQYPTNRKRPVKEYTALVSKRFERGPVVKHACDEQLEYEPTNYHIEINTLPPLMYNIDLIFDHMKVVAIPEPGEVQITNPDYVGKVQFWYKLGDAFVAFHEMMVTGDPEVQKVDFLPGLYQVRYYKNPDIPHPKVDIIRFRVKSNMSTSIHLEM